MIKLGIIGAENSHSHSVARLCNVDKRVPMRATHFWGETEASAAASAVKGCIPHVVRDWREMLSQVDGVMIDHRDGALHSEVATFFLQNRVPTFIDKPMTTSLSEARALFKLAAQKSTPVCTFGLIPLQHAFRKFTDSLAKNGDIQAFNTSGPADIDGPYNGIFFYGFHQIDAMVEVMGTEAESASLRRNGRNAVATIFFSRGRVATMNCLDKGSLLHWRACTSRDVFSLRHRYDKHACLPIAKALHRFLAKGEIPWTRTRMLEPIAILGALQKSLKSGTIEKVDRVS